MQDTKISWCDHTMNFWIGCTRVGPGCEHCYAEAWDRRYRGGEHWGIEAPRQRTSTQNWRQLLKWNKQTGDSGPRVMVMSLGDFFDNEVPLRWRADAWECMRMTPRLRYMITTKRIGNALDMLPPGWPVGFGHVGFLATMVDQKEVDRDLDKLKAIPGGLFKGVSIEPQLGDVKLCWFDEDAQALRGPAIHVSGGVTPSTPDNSPEGYDDSQAWLDLVITGGESAQGGQPARPYEIEWPRSLIKQCRIAGIACFVKQLGSKPTVDHRDWCPSQPDGVDPADAADFELSFIKPLNLKHRAGADPGEWPVDLRVQEMPEQLS